jgi:hypothetical protein
MYYNAFVEFCEKFGNNLKGTDRAYGHLDVGSVKIRNRLFWLDFLRYIGKSKNDTKTRIEEENANTDR